MSTASRGRAERVGHDCSDALLDLTNWAPKYFVNVFFEGNYKYHLSSLTHTIIV